VRVALASDGYYLCNDYTLFVTFGYLLKLYIHVCEINDHVHTFDEYLVLLTKSGMTPCIRFHTRRETDFCFYDCQVIGLLPTKNKMPLVLLLSSTSPP
jgi:hypothetical protein